MGEQLTYDEAVCVLGNALTFGINPSLDPIRKMCEAMGNPEQAYQCVQVAGTNGKTSTTRMIAALLHAQGLHVGLYVSPHLVKYPERMEIDGEIVGDQAFAESITAAVQAAEDAKIEATEFELLTSAALWLFAREKVDWVVLECGMGGRWDATSVVVPKVAVITGVALEHTEILGDTIEKIAGEKAAIIKPGSNAVFAHDLKAGAVFEQQAAAVDAPFVYANPFIINEFTDSLDHLPGYQRSNAATALTAATIALGHPIARSIGCEAFGGLVIPGRFERLSTDPLVLIDAAHNPQSAQTLAKELSRRFIVATLPASLAKANKVAGKVEVPTLLLGVLADKDVRGVVGALCPLFFRVVVTASSSPRSISAGRLAAIVEEETGRKPEIIPTIRDAASALKGESFIATGSITVAGELKGVWC